MMNSHTTNPSATTTSTNPTSSGVMNEHLSDSQLPKAEEVELTPEEVEFISKNTSSGSGSGSGSGSEEGSEGDMSGSEGDKKHVRMSKGAVGAAVVGKFDCVCVYMCVKYVRKVCVCEYECVCMCVYVCVCVYVYVCVYACMKTHMSDYHSPNSQLNPLTEICMYV